MADCLENFQHEEILNCPTDDVQAGLAEGQIYYTLTDFISAMTMPTATTFAAAVTIADESLTMLEGKGFQRMRCQVDMNSLASALVGNAGNKKDQSTLTVFLAGFRAQLLGLKKLTKNAELTFIVKDRNGKQYLIGTKLNPARIDNFELTTGTGAEDDNGGTMTIISNSIVYEFTGDIPLQTEPVEP